MNWLSNNWLAMYAAIVGTVALAINFVRFIDSRKRDAVQLTVSGERHENYDAQIRSLVETENEPDWGRPSLVKVYKITIANIGNVAAHIKNAGLKTRCGHTISVLSSRIGDIDSTRLGKLEDANTPPIEPKSSQEYWVYLNRGQSPFEATSFYVVDRTGKQWNGKPPE